MICDICYNERKKYINNSDITFLCLPDASAIEAVGLVTNDKTRIIAEYRLKYPEASLQELSEIIGVETESKLSKSGVYHRMKKITEIAERIK